MQISKTNSDQSAAAPRPLTRTLLAATAVLLYSGDSHAYIDPGTGSILLQGLLAGIAVALGVARTYWQRIKAFFSRSAPGVDDAGGERDAADREDPEAQSHP